MVITTDLTISGKAAQFGRGVLADVSSNLIGQFAKSLEADLLGGSAETQAPTAETATAAAQPDNAIDSVDLLKAVALPMAKRCGAGGGRGRRGCGRRIPAGTAQAQVARGGGRRRSAGGVVAHADTVSPAERLLP